MASNLILIGWGHHEYMAAGAAACLALERDVDVYGVSKARLCEALAERAKDYANTYVLGVGLAENLPKTIAALRQLKAEGRKVFWLSRMEMDAAEPVLRKEFGASYGFTKVVVKPEEDNLVAVVGGFFKSRDAKTFEKFCRRLSKREARSDKDVVAVYQQLFEAASYYHRENHDDEFYGQVVKKLAETQNLSELKQDAALMRRLEFFNKYGDDAIVGEDPSTRELLRLIDKAAPCDSTNVLILGETGTGKELIAKQLHRKSSRKEAPLIVDNCACMDGDLVNDLLFGHNEGAFTGATYIRKGLIEQADGGTLFLDEIGELPLETQSKLLRVLDSHKLVRLGGKGKNGKGKDGECEQIDVDFRLVAATNRDLVQRVADGKFREDLLHRISTIVMHTTPLRNRREDIAAISAYRWPKITRRPEAKLSEEQVAALRAYDFPGNVRELNYLLERAEALGIEDFQALIAEHRKIMAPLIKKQKDSAMETSKAAEPAVCGAAAIADELPENWDEVLHLLAVRLLKKYKRKSIAAQKAGVSINTFKAKLRDGGDV